MLQTTPHPGESTPGPLNSVIEINVPGHFYQERQEATRNSTMDHDHDYRGNVQDTEAGRRSVDKKEDEQVYVAY